MDDGQKYRDFLVRKRTQLEGLEKNQLNLQAELSEVKKGSELLLKARDIVNIVIITTLDEVKNFISDCTSMCLGIVFGDEYKFDLEYEVKRDRSQAVPWIIKNGKQLDPKCEVGGGVIDVVSIGLRLVLWVLSNPRSSPVFVLDEPFRFVSRDLTSSIMVMLHELVKTFGLQIIMVSHNDELINDADMIYVVDNVNGRSDVRQCGVLEALSKFKSSKKVVTIAALLEKALERDGEIVNKVSI